MIAHGAYSVTGEVCCFGKEWQRFQVVSQRGSHVDIARLAERLYFERRYDAWLCKLDEQLKTDCCPEHKVGRWCCASTGICEHTTFGCGELDRFGYWEFPCFRCARKWERLHPEEGPCWPFTEQQLAEMRGRG